MTDKHFPETTITLHDDRLHATVEIGNETLVVDADSLTNFIGHLGQLREAMLPEVPKHSPQDRQFLQVGPPVLEVVESDDRTRVRIAFRTPTYGWIGFQFLREHALEVGRHLVATYGSPAATPVPPVNP
jgi:hypothetical protein